MHWSSYLHPDSVFLAQDQDAMVYRTPDGIALLVFSGPEVTVSRYPNLVAFANEMKVKHAGLVTRAAAVSRLES